MYPCSNVDNQPIDPIRYPINTTRKPIPTTSPKAIFTHPDQHFTTMKLLPTATLFLTSLFVTTTLANLRIEFDDLPSKLRAGASYEVKWTANQDYVSLLLISMSTEPNGKHWPAHQTISKAQTNTSHLPNSIASLPEMHSKTNPPKCQPPNNTCPLRRNSTNSSSSTSRPTKAAGPPCE